MKTRFFVRGLIVSAIAVMCVALAGPAHAQGTGTLHGRVVDATGNPVPDAVLTFDFLGDIQRSYTTKTDEKGLWLRSGLGIGQWSITVAKGNLVGKVSRVSVSGGANQLLTDITIAPAAGGGAGSPAAAGPQSSDKMVFAVPLDSKGKPITDLTTTDWEVREDGAKRSVVDAKPAADPMELVVLVDTAAAIQSYLPDIRAGLGSFVSAIEAGNPGASITLIGFGGQSVPITDAKMTSADRAAAIAKLIPNTAGMGVMLEAFDDASKILAKSKSSRRVIVTFNLENTAESSSGTGTQNLVGAVMATGASVYAISFRPPSAAMTAGNDLSSTGNANGGAERDNVLSLLTTQSGGVRKTISAQTALNGQFKELADLVLGQYMVVYKRPEGATPKELKIAVNRSGAKVLAWKSPPGISVVRTNLSASDVEKHNKRQTELAKMFQEGDAAFEAGNYDDALAKFTVIATEVPKCSSCYCKIGDVYFKKGDLDNAEKSYQQAIDVDPTQADAYGSLASLYNQQKKFDQASKMSAKANELKGPTGGDAQSIFNQGIIYWNQSKIPEARVQFEKAIQLDPKLADAHYWLGMAIVNAQKLAESKKEFEEYLKLAPTGQYAETAKAILATIKT